MDATARSIVVNRHIADLRAEAAAHRLTSRSSRTTEPSSRPLALLDRIGRLAGRVRHPAAA